VKGGWINLYDENLIDLFSVILFGKSKEYEARGTWHVWGVG